MKPAHQRLEEAIGDWVGFPPEQVVAVSSGTTALQVALASLRLIPGSTVLIPDYTMIACARAATLANLHPMFADVRPADLLLDPDEIDRLASKYHLDAVMPVHLFGRRCPMDEVHVLAEKHSLKVVEDLAEAHGIRPHPKTDAACWSFYRNKVVAGEEGGAIAFRDPTHAHLARRLRCLGFTDRHDYRHIPNGTNARLADSLAELILESLAAFDDDAGKRRQAEVRYDSHCPDEWRMPPRDAVWQYDLRIPRIDRGMQEKIVRALNLKGIAARMGFYPLSAQEEYQAWHNSGNEVALQASEGHFYLPCGPGTVTEESAALAFEIIRRTLAAPHGGIS